MIHLLVASDFFLGNLKGTIVWSLFYALPNPSCLVRAQRGVMSLGTPSPTQRCTAGKEGKKGGLKDHTKYSPPGCSCDKPVILPSTPKAHIS